MGDMKKKGQVTIFIIIALLVVVFGIAIYLFFPEVVSTAPSLEENPRAYIQNCIQEELEDNIEIIASQGGSMDPELKTVRYRGEEIQYLCYTNEYYAPCVIQMFNLESSLEEEIKESINDKVDSCFDSMRRDYEIKGYVFSLDEGDLAIDLLPQKILLTKDNFLTLTKESSENYDGFNIILDNNLYELLGIATTVIQTEQAYGRIVPQVYRELYSQLKVKELYKFTDGTTIYSIQEREGKNEFQFAIRSLVWPGGTLVIEGQNSQEDIGRYDRINGTEYDEYYDQFEFN